MRVCLGYFDVNGYFSQLKVGFDQLNVDSNLIELIEHGFKYSKTEKHALLKLYLFVAEKRRLTPRFKIIQKITWITLYWISKLSLFLWILMTHDVFILAYTSLFTLKELLVLRLFRKKIIWIFFGCEARPPYISGKWREESDENLIKDTLIIKKRIEIIERYANYVIFWPTPAHLLKKSTVSYPLMGKPFSKKSLVSHILKQNRKNRTRILHSPSHPETKELRKFAKS